jgi:4-amino-4-deoxy-L-arabinose transferase-like glycosyltransferase
MLGTRRRYQSHEGSLATGSVTLVPATPQNQRFWWLLVLFAVLGAGLRVVYVLTVTREDKHLYDATWYELQAREIADGGPFFEDPFEAGSQPAADHAPLTVLFLVPAAVVAAEHDSLLLRLSMVAVGCGTIVLTGLLGRRVAGATVGLLAAGLAVINPNLWMNDGLIMSESLATLLTTALVLVLYRVIDEGPTARLGWLVGALGGLMVLSRGELALLVLALVIPALASHWRTALGCSLATGAALLLVVAPWIAFNLSRFEETTTISTNLGLAIAAGNCPRTYGGQYLGWASPFPPCTAPRDGREQSVWDAELRRDGVAYVRAHLDRVPPVIAARLGRLWNVYRIDQSLELTSGEGRPVWAGRLGVLSTWALVPAAIAGGVHLRRRRRPIWPLVVPLAATTAIAAALSGIPRYRAPAEPMLVVLASAAAVALSARWARRPQ